MKFKEKLFMALNFFSRDKTRSALTLIGIVVGILTILLIVGVGKGLLKSVEKTFESFGKDKLFVIPSQKGKAFNPLSIGRAGLTKLYKSDVKSIERIKGVKSVSYYVWARARVVFKDKAVETSVYGVSGEEAFEQWEGYLKLEKGRFLKDNDGFSCVLGNDVANELFKENIRINDKLEIAGKKFRVVGILEKLGSAFSKTDDQAIYIPERQFRELFSSLLSKDEVSFIVIQASEENLVDSLKKKVEDVLRRRHKVKKGEEDFTVVTAEYIKELTGGILNTLYISTIILASIASFISGLGIANTLYTSVVEKTKEIGILKALGMKNKDVVSLFIIESALFGLLGGGIGMALAFLIGLLLSLFGIKVVFDGFTIAIALLYSIAVGVISGYIPAKSSTSISPIEAMRAL